MHLLWTEELQEGTQEMAWLWKSHCFDLCGIYDLWKKGNGNIVVVTLPAVRVGSKLDIGSEACVVVRDPKIVAPASDTCGPH